MVSDRALALERLTEPFEPSAIKWKVGARNKAKTKGLVFAYLDARAIRARLDAVVGAENWSVQYRPSHPRPDGKITWVCRITLWPHGDSVEREDAADDTDVETGKGGVSDAFKRAFSALGCDYLYYLPDVWVDLDERGNLPRDFRPPTMPAWALPGGSGHPPVENASNVGDSGFDEVPIPEPPPKPARKPRKVMEDAQAAMREQAAAPAQDDWPEQAAAPSAGPERDPEYDAKVASIRWEDMGSWKKAICPRCRGQLYDNRPHEYGDPDNPAKYPAKGRAPWFTHKKGDPCDFVVWPPDWHGGGAR